MRRLSTFLAALGAVFAMSSAQATTLIVDDFSQPIPGQVIADNTGAGVSQLTANPSAYASGRTLTHTLLTASAIGSNGSGNLSSAGTGDLPNFLANQLNMSNGNGVDSVVRVDWTLASIAATTPASFLIDITSSDPGVTGNVNTIEAFLNGVSLGLQNAGAVGTLSFSLSFAQASSLATAGQVFSLVMNGAPAWDMGLDNLRLQIPEPASLALVGLALLAAGLAARRSKA